MATALNPVEAEMLAFIRRRLAEGAMSVPESEVIAAVIPQDHPEFRFRPAYRRGLERLHRRRQVWAIQGREGELRYYLDPHRIPWQDAAPPEQP